MGNSSRASFLAGVTFCFLCILPFLSADLLCPLNKVHPQGLSIICWNLTLNLLRPSKKTAPMTPAEGLQPLPGVPPAACRGALLWARLSASVHAPLGSWAVTQACVVPAPFLSKREAAWGPRECPPHIRGQGLLIFVMNLPQQIPRDVLSHQRLILALLRHFYFTLRGISVLSNL